MSKATLAYGNDPAVDTWLDVDPDVYLDERRPEWRAHEVAGLIRFVRQSGERRGRLRVAPAAAEVIEAVRAAATAREPGRTA